MRAGELVQRLQLTRAMRVRMRGENLFDERRAGARHADDEDRQIGPRSVISLRREKFGGKDLGDARHPKRVRFRIVGEG